MAWALLLRRIDAAPEGSEEPRGARHQNRRRSVFWGLKVPSPLDDVAFLPTHLFRCEDATWWIDHDLPRVVSRDHHQLVVDDPRPTVLDSDRPLLPRESYPLMWSWGRTVRMYCACTIGIRPTYEGPESRAQGPPRRRGAALVPVAGRRCRVEGPERAPASGAPHRGRRAGVVRAGEARRRTTPRAASPQ
jgi:hypothetical protein